MSSKRQVHGAANAARAASRPAEVIDMPQLQEDERLARAEGNVLAEFVNGLLGFFRAAGEIEKSARATREQALALTPPTTADEDERIQRFVKQANTDRRVAEDHWEITSRVSQFHKRLVAGRKRATDLLEESATIGNRLHNGYTDAERRRVQVEEDRRRREAEDKVRREREEAFAKAEAEAVAREEACADLSDREKAFVDFYVNPSHSVERGDAYRAAARAGFKDPQKHAARLISLPKIMDAIRAKQEALAIRQQAAVRREEPLHVEVEAVKPNISRAAGAIDRTTHSAEVYDVEAFMAALLDPRMRLQLGIPAEIATFSQPKVNDAARALHEKIERWPGVRYIKKTTVV